MQHKIFEHRAVLKNKGCSNLYLFGKKRYNNSGNYISEGDFTMARADEGLAFLLRYENVAWYEDGKVRILDRRCYPHPVSFVTCNSSAEVAAAIKDMVTQSAGPYLAAGMGMVLAAYEAKDEPAEKMLEHLRIAAYMIANARPTTAKRMAMITNSCLEAAETAIIKGDNVIDSVMERIIALTDNRYRKIEEIAKHLVDKFPDEGTVMTQCFAETILGFMCKECKARGKKIKFICPETRPYFQGARLTASVIHDMGFDVTVITDNMPGWTMHEKNVDLFTCAADAITMDGYVVNKVGTFQIALAAKYWGVPFYVTGAPDKCHEFGKDVTIEERDQNLVLEALGNRTAVDGVKGFYPAFDKTPPELVTGVVTDRGIYDPDKLWDYYAGDGKGEYELVV